MSRLLRGLFGTEAIHKICDNAHASHESPSQRSFRANLLTATPRVEHDEDDGDAEDADCVSDAMSENDPLLPVFSPGQLDLIPVYHLTHTVRLQIVERCETTLSWDQLRSPQISQFLIKPIQNTIRSYHFNRATLYALLANCLQFKKEAKLHPGNYGVLCTRAMISELLAIRLLKDFTPGELIDALSYDFDPTHGINNDNYEATASNIMSRGATKIRIARISCLEVAIRAQAKRFLSHPVVVQHLEAVWAGLIVFHFEADDFHRTQLPHKRAQEPFHVSVLPARRTNRWTWVTSPRHDCSYTSGTSSTRRSIKPYNPATASLFKLSRLRVPRYRQIFSLCSYSVMLCLFVAVLAQNEINITALEIMFWFWSAGFMLSEIVDFSEQGFGLFLASVWNVLDVGILLLFLVYYCLRLYGVFLAGRSERKIANWAYEVLGSTAVFLFPRLFAFLDHYKYFSQLLIAFRLMASDLFAVLILIAISCSGFFVALSLSFARNILDANSVAYSLFQILMGFTPAAWSVWSEFSPLGKIILILLLVVAHFLIVTILITVLSNSFMTVAKNANEEHQFLFAINTISMVKSDALFSYIAPSNLLGWAITPLRHVMPFHQFVQLNRTLIKFTHLPILFFILVYEKWWLAVHAAERDERIHKPGLANHTGSVQSRSLLYSPENRIRETSKATFRKDQALEEVFRSPFGGTSTNYSSKRKREWPSSVVDQWICGIGDGDGDGDGDIPMSDEARSTPDRAQRKHSHVYSPQIDNRERVAQQVLPRSSRADLKSLNSCSERATARQDIRRAKMEELNIEEEFSPVNNESQYEIQEDGFSVAQEERTGKEKNIFGMPNSSTALDSRPGKGMKLWNDLYQPRHVRESSSSTVLFSPLPPLSLPRQSSKQYYRSSRPVTAIKTRKFDRREVSKQLHRNEPTNGNLKAQEQGMKLSKSISRPSIRFKHQTRRAIACPRRKAPNGLASDIGDNRYADYLATEFGPSNSFVFQSKWTQSIHERQQQDSFARVERLMLARMNAIEENFRDVLHEVREWRNAGGAFSDRFGLSVDTAQ